MLVGRAPRRWLLVAWTAGAVLLGAWAHRSGIVTDALFRGRAALEEEGRMLLARLRSDPLELRLDIEHVDFLRLAKKREEALKRNLLVSDTDDFVPARIRTADQNLRVEVRLKGDLRDHWADDKWSLRVKVKGEDTLLGIKQFSLQHPRTRGYVSEWVYHEALRREGLPALRYRFVRVHLNGKDMGIYALEEHFEKRLIESNDLREGPIVRFSEELAWAEAARQGFLRFGEGKELGGAGSFLAADVDAFQTTRWIEDETAHAVYRRALALLDGFRAGTVRTSEAFDAGKLARFLAVSELLGSAHAAGWRNMRFYYNPVTALLEPIGFDAGGHGVLPIPALVYTIPRVYTPQRGGDYYYNYLWFDRVFADDELYAAYVRELERVSTPEYLRGLLADLGPGIDECVEILNAEFPEVDFSDRVLWENRAYIRSMLEPERAVQANVVARDERGLVLAVGNLQYLPVEVLGVARGAEVVARPRGGPQVLPGRDPAKPVELVELVFRGGPELAPAGEPLALRCRMVGLAAERSEPVREEPPAAAGLAQAAPRSTFETFDCAVADAETRTVAFLPGAWRIDRDFAVPAGWRLVAGPGTELDLVGGALIVSRSPVRFAGTPDAPVVVGTSDGLGQGLVVLTAGEPSTLEHVRFEGLSTPSRPGWQLTGAVTFYESPLEARACVFRGNTCEDALNVIRSRFALVDCLFESTFSDAFDADFCEGELDGCSFVRPGNDGVDVSGSSVTVRRLFVTGAGDKGVSAGEDSRVTIEDVRVEDSFIGLASKDLSELTVEGARVLRCRYGVAAYQKKPEFGPSRVRAAGLVIEETETPFLIERRSSVTADGEEREGNRRAVYDTLYGPEE